MWWEKEDSRTEKEGVARMAANTEAKKCRRDQGGAQRGHGSDLDAAGQRWQSPEGSRRCHKPPDCLPSLTEGRSSSF